MVNKGGIMRKTIISALILLGLAAPAHAETTKFNPFTGKPDYIGLSENGDGSHLTGVLKPGDAPTMAHMPTNVADAPYNADRTGAVDATYAILAAIDAKGGRVYLPKGTYKINSGVSQLVVRRDGVILEGDGPETVLVNYGTGDAVRFESDNPSLKDSIRWRCGIDKLSITRASAVATGAALHLLRVGNFELGDVALNEHYEDLLVEGSINSDYRNPRFYAGAVQTARMVGSAHIRIRGYATTDGDGYYEGFTHKFYNITVSGGSNKVVDYGLDFGAGDTVHIDGGYFGMVGLAHLRLKGVSGASLYNFKSVGVFYDGVTELTGTDKAVLVEDDGAANNVSNVEFIGNTFGQVNYGVDISDPNSSNFQFSGNNFHNIAAQGLSGTASGLVANLSGNTFDRNGFNDSNGGAVYFSGVNTVNITGTTFRNMQNGSNSAIKFAGTIGQGALSGNTYTLCNNKVVNTATFTNGLISGDVTGPASSAQYAIPTFADTNGKLLQSNTALTYSAASLKHEVVGGTGYIQNTTTSTGSDTFPILNATNYLGTGSTSAGYPLLEMENNGGTSASKEALPSAKRILMVRGKGFDGSASAVGVDILAETNGLWTTSNHGTDVIVKTTSSGSSAYPSERVRINGSGMTVTGDVAVTGTVDGVDVSTHAADVTTKHLPAQASAAGKFLTSNGTAASWSDVNQTPAPASVVKNGGFESGTTGWGLSAFSGASATLATETGSGNYRFGAAAAKIIVTTGTATVGNIQFTGGINDAAGVLVPGETYIAQMWIKATTSTTGKTFAVALSGSPFTSYLSTTIAPTTSWQLVQGRFTYSGAASDTVRVIAQFGGSDSDGVTYYIDGVSIMPVNGYRGVYSRDGASVAYDGTVTATQVVSTAASGTPPLVVPAYASGATVAGLSADLLDGQHGSYYAPASNGTLTNPTVGGGIYSQTTSTTIDTAAVSGASVSVSGAASLTITNVVSGRYFDFEVCSSGGGAISIATLTPTYVSGVPATIAAGKCSWFVGKGTGANTAKVAAIKENY